jgi:hypothetical protein|tara:strand:+ start:8566 stop:9264 length:699 start_codon:yes stop_codon:yes gene_type:complete
MNQITFQDVLQTTTVRGAFKLGERATTPDGREWVYVKANSLLALGSIAVPDAVTAVDACSSSQDNQSRNRFITKASAGWTVGQFEDAWGVVDDGTGAGQVFKIQTNSVDTLTLYPEYALSTALSVSDSDITIRTMAEVDKAAITSKVQQAVGVAQVAFAASEYGWLLTNGEGGILVGEVLTIGAGVTTGDDTTGQGQKAITAEGPFDAQLIGISLVANAAADQVALCRILIR